MLMLSFVVFVILIVYEIACTILGFIKAGWGIVLVSGATIMVNIAVSIVLWGSQSIS